MCNSTDLPEFEIISLLEEQLPVYRLRADTVYGYDHDDWLHTPLVAPDARLDLTTEQIEETLKYFCKSDQSAANSTDSILYIIYISVSCAADAPGEACRNLSVISFIIQAVMEEMRRKLEIKLVGFYLWDWCENTCEGLTHLSTR